MQKDDFELALPSLNLSRILEKIIMGGILFILALPVLGDYGLTLFPLGRDVIFKLIVEFLILAVFLKKILDSRESPPGQENRLDFSKILSPLALSLLAFFIVMTLATLASVQPEFSLWGNIYKNQGLLTWIHYLLFFVLLLTFLKNPRHWRIGLYLMIWIATAVSLIAVFQLLQNGMAFRAFSTLNNSNYLASYLLLISPVSFAFFLEKKSFLLGISSLLQFIALISTQARGAILGIIAATLVFATLYLIYQKKATKRKVLAFVAVPFLTLLACYALLVFTPQGEKIQRKLPAFTNRFLSIQGFLSSSAPRLEAWRAGLKGILEKPLLGYGPENFFVAYDQFYSGFLDHTGSLEKDGSLWESWFDKAHNFIFDIGATSGLLGLFAYASMFIFAMYILFKNLFTLQGTKLISIGLISSLVGYLVQNLLGFDTTVTGICLMFFFAYSLFLDPRGKTYTTAPLRQGIWLFGFIIVTFFFAVSLKIHFDILKANYQLNRAEILAQKGRMDDAFGAFEKGLAYHSPPINPNLRRRYAVISLAYYDAVKKHCESAVDEKCEQLFADSKKYLARALVLQQENAAKEWPRFTRNYIYAAQISHILGDYENSDIFFKKALELSPHRASISTEWSRLKKARE
ncbi:MAG: O-antigen ligase family protein [Candidatus Spechtbacteria bacterium]|nr:O-antigen ligase family protein [Candidatus Spechtbacteria bacterium]